MDQTDLRTLPNVRKEQQNASLCMDMDTEEVDTNADVVHHIGYRMWLGGHTWEKL